MVDCSNCSAGRYSSVPGLTKNSECELCPSGGFSGVAGLANCSKCPVNYYQNKQGQTHCIQICGSSSTTGARRKMKFTQEAQLHLWVLISIIIATALTIFGGCAAYYRRTWKSKKAQQELREIYGSLRPA